MAEARNADNRPLSPHLQIYHVGIHMLMSILHRITGAALAVGTVLLAWWLWAAAGPEDYFDWVNGIAASWPGRLVLLGYTWALMHHLFGGLRHLIWDTGIGFELSTVRRLSWLTLACSILTTLLIWIAAYGVRGAP